MGHFAGGQGVGGSNPLAPTILPNIAKHLGRSRLFALRVLVANSAAILRLTVQEPPQKSPYGVPRAFSESLPALAALQLCFDGFAQKVRLVLAGLEGCGDARQRARRQRRNDLIWIEHLPTHLRAGNAYGVCGQAVHISHMPY